MKDVLNGNNRLSTCHFSKKGLPYWPQMNHQNKKGKKTVRGCIVALIVWLSPLFILIINSL